MDQFNLGNFLNKVVNYSLSNLKGGPTSSSAGSTAANAGTEFKATQDALVQSIVNKATSETLVLKSFSPTMLSNLKMNNLASLEKSLYIKDLMHLPKDMEEVLVMLQNTNIETKEIAKLLTTNINISQLAEIMQKGGKEAMNKLVLVMSEASKQGITDTSQIKEAMKFINASVSVAGKDNMNQVLKSFMLLYLPWLPLQEGVDFELEIESSGGEENESEMSLTIMISTRNYGNVKVTLILLAQNSIEIFVHCSDQFPKKELLQRINTESKMHAIQSNVMFEEKITKQNQDAPVQAKVSLSNVKEVNPFLLLMANAVIKHTIDLDNQAA